MQRTALMRAYGLGAQLALPYLAKRRIARLTADDVPALRAREVLGHATAGRPDGPLLWVHAASVGESLSVLPIIAALQALRPALNAVMTTATPTAARLLDQRLPPRAVHQFAPLDAPGSARQFLDHWRPDAAVFVESEIWPTLLSRSQMPAALIGARLSDRSLTRWSKAPRTAAAVLGRFALILTQNADMTRRLQALSRNPDRIETGTNLKALSGPLPADPALMAGAQAALDGRPVWIAASTHRGEEAQILQTHRALLQHQPDLCLILAPRHPGRSAEVQGIITQHGLSHSVRSTGGLPTRQVWLTDTLGELGSLYPLSPIVFLGGSLVPIGGHNPYEVAHAGAAILSGPHVDNFSETYAPLVDMGAAQLVASDALTATLTHLLESPEARGTMQSAARAFAQDQRSAASDVAARLLPALHLETHP